MSKAAQTDERKFSKEEIENLIEELTVMSKEKRCEHVKKIDMSTDAIFLLEASCIKRSTMSKKDFSSEVRKAYTEDPERDKYSLYPLFVHHVLEVTVSVQRSREEWTQENALA